MMPTTDHTSPEDGVLSDDAGRNEFDELARTLMFISGDEFLRRWDAGAYREVGD
jgi:hypothetical protein